ncbi:MAG: flagellar hook-length control protein FliK [Burkholderiaceae bacterium]
MNTAPIQPQSASSASSASSTLAARAGKPAANGDASFDRVLSQEVSQRSAAADDADTTPKTPAADAAPGVKTDGAQKTKATDDKKEAKKDDAPEEGAAGTATADGRIDLLALVTDSSRFAAGAARTDASQDGTVDTGTGAKTARLRPDASLPATAQEAVAGAHADDRQSLAAAAPDFGAALARSAGAKDALAEAAAKALPKQDAVEAPALPEALPAPLQQAAATVAAAAAGAIGATGAGADRLAPQVGTPAWDQALGQKIVWMVGSAQQTAALSLNAPDLGPLQVVLSVSNTQASATFVAAQPEVRQALEAAMPRLRDMMSDAGIQLGQASVNAGMPNGQQAMPQPQQHFQSGQRDAGGPAVSARVDPVAAPTAGMRVLPGRGMVDTFA